MLSAPESAMARWGVSQVTADNITNQLASLYVQATQRPSDVYFIIKVKETDRMWFESRFTATLLTPGHAQKPIEPTAVTTNGRRTVTYELTLPTTEITDDTAFFFWIHPDPESPLAHLGGFYYHIVLKSFVAETETSNQSLHSTFTRHAAGESE